MGGCPEHEDLFEYALAGMEGEQRVKVKEHLSKCPPCMEQIKEYAAVHEGLALTVPEIECPETVVKAVLERIRAEGQPVPVHGTSPISGWAMFWMRLGPVFAVLSLVMTMVTMLALQKAGSVSGIKAGDVNISRISALMASPRVRTIGLESPDKSAACSGSITCARDSRSLMVTIDKLKRCPMGSVYVIWNQLKDGNMARLGSFVPSASGTETIMIDLKDAIDPMTSKGMKVTLEPNAEVEKPTGEIHLVGTANL